MIKVSALILAVALVFNESTIFNNINNRYAITENENLSTEQLNEDAETYNEESNSNRVNIKMVGDCLIHSPLYKSAYQKNGGYNFDMLFEHVKSDIESADLAIINQETIFVSDRNKISSYPMFGSPVEVGDAEVKAGFDVIACATNHTMDKGTAGINDTIAFWKEKHPEITYLGIHDSADDKDVKYIEKNGINIALVNYTYGLNGLESRRTGKEYSIDMLSDTDIEATLAEAENLADITVAILHVGNEHVYKPTAYAVNQVDRFIDNGADIVLCAHPHVIEPYELRTTASGKTGLVYYSLGNFISNQNEIPRILGGMADITIEKTESGEVVIESFDMIPLVTHQQSGYYTTYKLSEYTDELCKVHKLYGKKNFNCNSLIELWNSVVSVNNSIKNN